MSMSRNDAFFQGDALPLALKGDENWVGEKKSALGGKKGGCWVAE